MSEAVTMILAPAGCRLRAPGAVQIGDYELSRMRVELHPCIRLPIESADEGFSFDPPPLFVPPDVVVLNLYRYRGERRYRPRERRRLARAGKRGRRGAVRAPRAERWQASVYAPSDAPEWVKKKAAEEAQRTLDVEAWAMW